MLTDNVLKYPDKLLSVSQRKLFQAVCKPQFGLMENNEFIG